MTGCTVLSVHIVISTAEPRGAYHLEPLYQSMMLASPRFTHLVPYPEPLQGLAWSNVSSDPAVLESADLVVVTGGGFTAWTELVARRADELNKPWIVSELAYGSRPDGVERPHPHAVSAMSRAGAELFSAYHGVDVDDVVITGIPLLDNLPTWRPEPKRALILSSVDTATRDPDNVLRTLATRLVSEGWDVVVRTHPREDREPWSSFRLDASLTPAHAASSATVVIGYPGSAHPICAAIGVPTVAVAPTPELYAALPPAHCAIIPTWVERPDDLDTTSLLASSSATIEYVCGPIGGSAQRLVDFWISSRR
jgi:hypothetical protein